MIRRFALVSVEDRERAKMLRISSPFRGIVEGSYWDIYHHQGSKNTYCIHILDKKGKKIVNTISWFDRKQIIVLDDTPITVSKNIDFVQGY